MKPKLLPLTKAEAFNYFGGIKGLNNQPLPYSCSVCGKSCTEWFEKGERKIKYIMDIPSIYNHVRKSHKKVIKDVKPIDQHEE